jgi:hypothetical protein
MMTLTADAHGLRGREFRFWCDPPARFCENFGGIEVDRYFLSISHRANVIHLTDANNDSQVNRLRVGPDAVILPRC